MCSMSNVVCRSAVRLEHGQIDDTHSISAGLDYPGVGPELSNWKDSERAKFVAATDAVSETHGLTPREVGKHHQQKD